MPLRTDLGMEARQKPVGSIGSEQDERPSVAQETVPTTKPLEPFKPTDEPPPFLDTPAFLPPKPIPHSPKISPSSIPNPNPSVTTTKQVEPGYPNYGGYIYSIPGYSAFQPVSYPGVVQPSQAALPHSEPATSEYVPFPVIPNKDTALASNVEEKISETKIVEPQPQIIEKHKTQTDYEEKFTPAIIPTNPTFEENKNQGTESKMNITSLGQGSGATVTIPIQQKEIKKKTNERFSLKTSIPISKIDMKCVPNPSDVFQAVIKKPTFNSTFSNQKPENGPRVEIQSNIVIKSAPKDSETKELKMIAPAATNSISTLINAAEMINKTDDQMQQKIENTNECQEVQFVPQVSTASSRSLFNPNIETNKSNFISKQHDSNSNEQKNQIVFIQNKNSTNSKMLVTIQQQNPQVLVQRSTFDPKNSPAPSRLSGQGKKCKEDILNDNGSSSKVVALKRLHQENCDENDFENLITENQIYGNKIVVKEKSQGTLQEQDIKSKKTLEKPSQADSKNVVLQPNFLYLSNVQFPANVMMIKNNKPGNDVAKANKTTSSENKPIETICTTSSVESPVKVTNTQSVVVSKEAQLLKSNNILQSTPNKTKQDIVFQAPSQKVIMNSQIVYQVPMLVDSEKKMNPPFVNKDHSKSPVQSKSEFQKPYEPPKTNEKLFIACPYQMDSKLQPKIVITNLRPKISTPDEVSSLDLYEKKKRMRRMKYLSNRDGKDTQKQDQKKNQDSQKNIITPDKMKAEIYKEFTNTRVKVVDDSSDADSDYDEDALREYNSIIKDYETKPNNTECEKIDFLAGFDLATKNAYKEKELERMERILKRDSIAAAYIAAGRLDRIFNENSQPTVTKSRISVTISETHVDWKTMENEPSRQRKQTFLSQLSLVKVTPKYKEGYERAWLEIIKDRKRRYGTNNLEEILKQPKLRSEPQLDPNDQLQMLTEIKKHVNDNNNLIKKRLDSSCEDGDSIRVLAEKNFSELNRLSKMADNSVKHFSGQDTRKRDLNPGFDSENIQKPVLKLEQPFQNYPNINIPNISKIISLKSNLDPTMMMTSQATSMDEPQNSAAGVREMFNGNSDKVQDFGCQVDHIKCWPGIEAAINNYREFEIGRKKEIAELQRRNTALRVEAAHITRTAARDAERARALLAERHNLASEEARVSHSLHRLYTAVDFIKKC
ncbi:kinesin-related protein 4-like [Battus philenor]|uniref:kinesin-related protein 4-like n=1 Tax=Battus philenor TaxID=42288 RepID=UPI0035CE9D7D